jgi:hypothetical protein
MDEVGERSRRNVVAYLNAGRLLANQTFRLHSVLLAKPKPDAGERESSGEYAQNRFEVSGGAVVQP